MPLWTLLRDLYSLDTLDTRLTTPPKAPVTNGAHVVNRDIQAKAKPSKWNTPEYYFYYVIFLTVIPLMFYVPYRTSLASHPEYPKFAPLLSDGWMFGRKVDNSDSQYATFRNNVPYLAALLIVQPLARRLFNLVRPATVAPNDAVKPDAAGEARFQQRTAFDLGFGLVYVVALNGTSAAKVLLLLYLNYSIAKRLPKAYIPAATWVFNLAVLAANEFGHGYPYAAIARRLHLAPPTGDSWGSVLDSFGGLNPRWEVLFNITTMRLISFNLDYYWSLNRNPGSPLEKKQTTPATLSERDRVSLPAPVHAYSLSTYLAYVLYAPLFLAGPILTFNDYAAQARHVPASIAPRRTALYALRVLVCVLTMELVLHHIYVVAISKASPDWTAYSPFELSMLGFFNLNIIWLKLLIPWRFFRLWALLDGIDPPENMLRCVSNNFSTTAFWRAWHRSYNRWVVRYLYVPLGGAGGRGTSRVRGVLNMLIVFSFVAIWHDIQARLLLWGWLIVFFVLPEIVCTTVLFPAKRYAAQPELYRWLCGFGAVGNVLMMMVANMIGFVMGVDGVLGLVRGIVSGWAGWMFFVSAYGVLFVGVQVMFELRESEKRRGIDLKC